MKHRSKFFSRLSVRGIGTLALRLSFVVLACCASATAQTTVFTYQGKLADNGTAANGHYDFQFSLFDALSGGAQQGTTQTVANQLVTNGIFAVSLDFVNCSGCTCPTCFDGSPRFLEIAVKPTGGLTYTTLGPRQPVSATPYAIRSLNGLSITGGGSFENSNTFGGVGAGASNTPSGTSTDGNFNSFFGWQAGSLNTTGHLNSFFGWEAGGANVVGNQNAFFGFETGSSGAGNGNTLIGSNADFATAFATGDNNTLLGFGARLNSGLTNATAIGALAQVTQSNSLVLGGISGANGGTDTKVGIGTTAPGYKLEVIDPASNGLRVQTNGSGGAVASFGGNGAFFVDGPGTIGGRFAVLENGKVGIGANSPAQKLTVSGTGVIRALVNSDTNAGFGLGLNNQQKWSVATTSGEFQIFNDAIGQNALFINGSTNNVGIGAIIPLAKLHVFGTGTLRVVADSDSNAGFGLSLSNQQKWSMMTLTGGNFQILNDALVQNALIINGSTNNVGIGTTPTVARLTIGSTGNGLYVSTNPGNIVAGFGSNGEFQIDSSSTAGGRFKVREDSTVLINNPISGSPPDNTDRLIVNGYIKANIALGGTTQTLCVNSSQQIATCLSSSIRYKKNVNDFKLGLNLIRRLRPVSFNWKADDNPDLGLIAEEVEKVEPLLVTHNNKGEIEGVKYDRVAVVLLNAVKEQQAQIKEQTELIQRQQNELHTQGQLIKQQQSQLASLKRVVCKSHPKARNCQ